MSDLRLKLSGLVMLFLALALVSCEKENTLEEVENYVDESVFVMERNAGAGKHGCFEFVFSITVILPDGNEVEVDSYDALKETIRTWKEANPDVDGRPQLGFPLDVVKEDGELVTVNSKEELIELRKECRFNNDRPGDKPGRHCFRLQYPVDLELPDGTIVTAEDRMALKQILREWKHNNPDSAQRPHLVFPLSVVFRDGTVVEVGSPEELKALKEECRG